MTRTIAIAAAVFACVAVAARTEPPPEPDVEPTAHPALADFGEIVFVKRHHIRRPFGVGTMYAWQCWAPGGGICAFDPRKPDAAHREIFRDDQGVVYSYDLSWDAKRIVFAWMPMVPKGENSFHIYEIGVDGKGLRQITTGRYHDVDPVYLPSGAICFASTRSETYSMCQPAPGCGMYVMDPDGKDIRRIEYSTLGCYSPAVMPDGTILFMRWEYNDRSLFTRQSLWTINPNGTSLRLFYGNTLTSPNVLWQARAIPGSDRIVCTLAPHHGWPSGAVAMVDQAMGLENPKAITNLTPSVNIPLTTKGGYGPGDRQFPWAYLDPWPLSETRCLVAYGGHPVPKGVKPRYRLAMLEPGEKRTILCRDEKYSCFGPRPLRARKMPPALAGPVESPATTGTFVLQDVYRGLKGVPRGTVKALRVLSQQPKPCNMRGRRAYDHDPLIGRGTYYVKINHGRVPVEADGSACFEAPAGVELYFQALDANGVEVCRMGSLTQIMPGEVQGCVGCHEPRDSSATAAMPAAITRPPARLTPPPWGAGPVDFVRHVQPVLDKHCAKCHSGPRPDGGIDLSADKARLFNMAYTHLTTPKYVAYYWNNTAPTAIFEPMTSGSRVSRLRRIIESGHGEAKLNVDDAGRRAIYAWIDTNVPYYGTYDNTRPGTQGSRDLWTGEWFGEVNRLLKETSRVRKMDEACINLSHPQWSRVLVDHLPKDAGGRGVEPTFAGPDDPTYKALLAAIRRGQKAMNDKPRMDMPGGRPVPYPTDFGKLHTGFAGP
jgi:hypothetical protein